MSKTSPIYLDCHATTPVDAAVLAQFLPYFVDHFGNAASRSHRYGWVADSAIETARARVAGFIGARPPEVVFTSGATEAINLALFGLARDPAAERNHIVTQVTEHAAVLECVSELERRGFRVTRLGVDGVGRIDLEELRSVVDHRTLTVAIMAANNEIGTTQPTSEIGAICRKAGALFFCDLTQGLGWQDVDLARDGIDLASMSSHKIYGPKGVGALFVRRTKRDRLRSHLFGGHQERGMRPGTSNVPGIVGFGAAFELMEQDGHEIKHRVRGLRDGLQNRLFEELEGLTLNGCPKQRHPGNLNIAIAGVQGDDLLGALPEVAFSAGSACMSASTKYSHVIAALSTEKARLEGSIRFGVGKHNTQEEIDHVADRLIEIVRHLRKRAHGMGAEPTPARCSSWS